ncbi:MAG: tripartite tricarboxylate transporter substrate binding protein [Rhodospirillaceae bacterium]|nr:tripartite tricarboxylate transporter substrate binding protein [Rhodospirillaceae bacterium]
MLTHSKKFGVAIFAAPIALALTLGTILGTAQAADFPSKPIKFIIPFGAGGGADIEGRLLAKEMGKVLGVKLVPVNMVGGGGARTYTHVKNAAADGYTVAWNSTSILTTTNIGNVPFEHNALAHIGRVEWQPMPFAVKGNARWNSFADFIKECKANPGKLKVSNSGTGSATHLAAIQILDAAKCKVTHLPVGIKRRNASVLSGEADAMLAPLTGTVRLTKAKKLKLLTMATGKRSTVFPNVPTAKELGYNVTLDLFRGLSVPKNTPAAIKAKLAGARAKAAKSKAFMGLAKKKGFTVDPLAVDKFESLLAMEDAKIKGIMKSAGLYRSKKPKMKK